MNDLYDQKVRDDYEKEANQFTGLRSVPGGSYPWQPDEKEERVGDNPEITSLFERPYFHIGGGIIDATGQPRGRQWLDVSPVVYRRDPDNWENVLPEAEANPEWPMDRESKLFYQIAKAVKVSKEEVLTVGEVLDRVMAGSLALRLSEGFRLPDGNGELEWVYPVKEVKTAGQLTREQCIEARDAAIKEGYDEAELKTRNFPQSVGRVKA